MTQCHCPNDELAEKYASNPEWIRTASLEDLNQMRSKDFLNYSKQTGFKVIFENYTYIEEDKKYYTDEIKNELPQYSKDELLMVAMYTVFYKPHKRKFKFAKFLK